MPVQDEDRGAYRDTALKVLLTAISGVMGYVATITRTNPRWDSITVTWLAIIAIDIGVIGIITAKGQQESKRRESQRQHDEVLRVLDEHGRRLDLLMDAQQQVMRSALIRDAERYCRRGWLTPTEHRAFSEAYGSYERLGLNGYIRTYVQRVDALPLRDVDEALVEVRAESTD